MAMELLHVEEETVEPSTFFLDSHRQPPVAARRRIRWADIQAKLERRTVGRMLLDLMRCSVVVALIFTGFFAAAGIDRGVNALRNANPADAQQMLAASTAHK